VDRRIDEDRTNAGRIAQDRNFELNDANIRKMFAMQWHDPLHIEPHLIPQNMEYKWITDSIMGDNSRSKIPAEKRMGWTPVPAENHPEMMPSMDFGRKSHLDGYIHVKGLVLCQRPKRIGDIQRQLEHEACLANMQQIPGQDGSSQVPLRVHKNDVNILQSTQSFKED